MEFLRNLLSGLIIGVANIIPGVSGGTMAVVLGIYDKLINSVSTLRRNFKKNVLFLLPVGVGGVLGIVLFSKLIKFLLGNFPMATNFFFLGLIVGSVPMIFRRATGGGRLRPVHLLPLLGALAVMLAFTLLFNDLASGEVITTLSFLTVVRLVFSSALAAACMILPGISGSMVLVILGVYTSILTAISNFDVLFLIPVGVGVLLGLFGGAKIIDICMKRAPQGTYCAILGLIAGSVVPVFINAGFAFNLQAVAAIATFVAGVATAFLLEKLQSWLDQNNGAARDN